MIDKFHTLKELKDTGLKMFGSYVGSDTKIGEIYLQPVVISMWDWEDYSEFYTYFDKDSIHFLVNVCMKLDDRTTRAIHLKKDLSNINIKL